MTISELSKAVEARRPALNVAHGVRIGKSLRSCRARRGSRPSARDMLALKFMHVPDEADVTNTGWLTQKQNRISVELPTKSKMQTQLFSGSRCTPIAGSSVSDYILVFADGVFWLERVGDYVSCLRHDGSRDVATEAARGMDMQTEASDHAMDPDSWMIDSSAEGSGLQVALESEDGNDAQGTVEKSPDRQIPGQLVSGPLSNASSSNSSDGQAVQLQEFGQKNGPAFYRQSSKSKIAKKGACKNAISVFSTIGASDPITTAKAPNESSSDVVQTEEVVMETVVEVDDAGNDDENGDNDRASKSTSSESESDDSSSDSDSDSAYYTDRSSSDED